MRKSDWFVFGTLFFTIFIVLCDGGRIIVGFLGDTLTAILVVISFFGAMFCIGMGIYLTWQDQRELARQKKEKQKQQKSVGIKVDSSTVLIGVVATLIAILVFGKKRGVTKDK